MLETFSRVEGEEHPCFPYIEFHVPSKWRGAKLAILRTDIPSSQYNTMRSSAVIARIYQTRIKVNSILMLSGVFHFFAHNSAVVPAVEGGRRRKGLRQE